jgi:hypothetical protein
MPKHSSIFRLGTSVWFEINGVDAVGVIKSITFHEDGVVTYHLHNEEFKWPDSYLTIPESGLKEYKDD